MATEKNAPAFATSGLLIQKPKDAYDVIKVEGQTGLTKREYFAALAMQGILTGFNSKNSRMDKVSAFAKSIQLEMPEYIAQLSIKHADALIDELNKP